MSHNAGSALSPPPRDERPHGFREHRLGRLLRRSVLPRLPGRLARYGHLLLGRIELRMGGKPDRRALLVTHDLSRSGAPLLVVQIALLLRDAGWSVVVRSPVDGPFGDDLRAAGILVVIDPWPADRSPFLADLATAATIAICNTIDTAAAVGIIAPLAPTLLYLHEVSLLEVRIDDPDVRSAIDAAAVVWAGSPMCQQLLLPVRADAMVVPYGIDALADVPRASSDTRLQVGVFGSIEPRKGQDLAVAGYAALTDAQRGRIALHLYGRILDATFAAAVTDQSVRTGVTLHGEADRAGYIAAMQSMDAVLVSSRDDTLPIVSIDALGLGKMLLLVPSVGTATWLDDGMDALIGDATSAQGIRDLLVRALDRSDDRVEIGTAARAAHHRHFSSASFARQLLDTVAALAASQ